MAQDKKTVLLYVDLIHTVEKLSNEDAGLYFKHFLRYVNDLNPKPPSLLIDVVFEPHKQQLKRDLLKWENTIDERSFAGRKGGLKSGESRRNKMKQNEANEANASNLKQNEANEAVTVTDTVTVTVTDKVNVTEKKEKTQIEIGNENRYKSFMKWIDDYCPSINKMKEPFTQPQFEQIIFDKKLNPSDKNDLGLLILRNMHNKADLTKKYKSAYLTFLSWYKMAKKQ